MTKISERGGGVPVFSGWNFLSDAIMELQNTVVPESQINNIAYGHIMKYAMIDNTIVEHNTTNNDFNTLTKSGVYRFNSSDSYLNAPPLSWGQVLVLHSSGDTIAQIAFDFSSNTGIFYVREGNSSDVGGSGAWHSWAKYEGTTVS